MDVARATVMYYILSLVIVMVSLCLSLKCSVAQLGIHKQVTQRDNKTRDGEPVSRW